MGGGIIAGCAARYLGKDAWESQAPRPGGATHEGRQGVRNMGALQRRGRRQSPRCVFCREAALPYLRGGRDSFFSVVPFFFFFFFFEVKTSSKLYNRTTSTLLYWLHNTTMLYL